MEKIININIPMLGMILTNCIKQLHQQILEDSKPEPDPGCCGQKAEKKKKPVAVPTNNQKAASSIITEQPQTIQSVEESKEKINPADSGSVEIQDINPDIDEGHVEEERPEEP